MTLLFNKPALSKIILFAHRRTNTHTCTLSAAFSRDVQSAQNKTLIFPLPGNVPSKLSSRLLSLIHCLINSICSRDIWKRIFGFSTSEIFRGFLQLYGHLPCEHLASTGKQSDPTLRLVMIPRCRKTRWLKELDID